MFAMQVIESLFQTIGIIGAAIWSTYDFFLYPFTIKDDTDE